MSQKDYDMVPRWYVVHTYTGYEKKVKTDLEKTVENRELEEFFFNIEVPMMEVRTENEAGEIEIKTRKVFPGYILVKMIVTEETWYIVRNTRGVTSFVGSGTDPIPLTEDEIYNMGIEENIVAGLDFEVGDEVKVTREEFNNQIGKVYSIDKEKSKVKVLLQMFGGETAVEFDASQIKKVK